ncbi:unnamed protein product [Brachionus calyciflorus]|uniref:EGF-like domain-containing protein n=1 Tax=Brachionus calyciflorus TaxID=104777 RepID=A0A813VCB2_9BILA|nr:unnamed protein product [Brachionus calyciflorus]
MKIINSKVMFYINLTFLAIFLLAIDFVPFVNAECDENSCNVTDNKRCYETFDNTSEFGKKKCKCLRGLYELDNKCIGVLRFDLQLKLFKNDVLLIYNEIKPEIRTYFQSIPQNSSNVLITPKYNIDVERTIFDPKRERKPNDVLVLIKLVIWKKDYKNPNDLPQIELDQIKDFLMDYISKSYRYDGANNTAFIHNLEIGDVNLENFLRSFNIKYNNFTCSTSEYNYCFDHTDCTPISGRVKCKCNELTSIDISPQKDLFPGEVCEIGCTKSCYNGGLCRYKDAKFTCFCPDLYIGDQCQINILWFIIAAVSLVIMLTLLSCACGVFEWLYNKNREKQKLIQRKKKDSGDESENDEKRF